LADEIRTLTAELAADPGSLAFLRLGEALRVRGQRDAAQKVAITGLTRYPHLPDAHDLFARILVDAGDLERAFDEWDMALRLDAEHPGAHKGLGFLYYRAGDLASALLHLQTAAAATPGDESLQAAVGRVRADLSEASGSAVAAAASDLPAGVDDPTAADVPSTPKIFAGLEGAENGLLLLDANGMRLGGGLRTPGGTDVADVVAAHLSGVSREAGRTVKLLNLGEWQSLAVEAMDGNLALIPASDDALLLVARDRSVPMGRLAFLAERAAKAARAWLDTLR
jgi:predicted regulator of Ras-like GTPase activity (Roadblock/LC7/MglB family)